MPNEGRFADDFDDAIIIRPEHQVDPPPARRDVDAVTLDRAAGALLAGACGDALGIPYEYDAPPNGPARMLGGGLGDFAPGEWSDDTQMTVCIAAVAGAGKRLSGDDGLNAIASAFEQWRAGDPADIGLQTDHVLGRAAALPGRPAHRLANAAAEVHVATGRTAGNGALMRTSPVPLASLGDREETAVTARLVAELTHADPLAGDSCVLWSEAIRVAVVHGRVDLASGIDLLPAARRMRWQAWIRAAEAPSAPADLARNGFTVKALQCAWRAVRLTEAAEDEPSGHVIEGLQRAVRIGGDTDTVAAIAGGLLGARWGASAVPIKWRQVVHGWPGLRGDDLVDLAHAIVSVRPGRP